LFSAPARNKPKPNSSQSKAVIEQQQKVESKTPQKQAKATPSQPPPPYPESALLTDLMGIDMMTLPVEIEDSEDTEVNVDDVP